MDRRVVYLLVLLGLTYITLHAKKHVKVTNVQQTRMIHHYENTKQKLPETNLAIWFNKMFTFQHFETCTINIKTNVCLL
jgi:hypothetical protein